MGLLLFDAVPLDGLYKCDDLSPEALTEFFHATKKGWMENTSPLSQIHVETLSLYILFILRKIHLRICKLLQKVEIAVL